MKAEGRVRARLLLRCGDVLAGGGTWAGASRGEARVMAPGDWLELLVRLGVGGECIVSQAHGSELMESGVRSGEGKP